MPFNLLKNYNELLELTSFNVPQRTASLRGVFNRDIAENESFQFQGKQINPTSQDGEEPMETLFRHLTTVIEDKKTNKRVFEMFRSERLHWIRHHIEERKQDNMFVFSVKESGAIRTYIYDKDEKYVIILEWRKNRDDYYLLTAYHLRGKDEKRDKIMKKYKRRLENIY